MMLNTKKRGFTLLNTRRAGSPRANSTGFTMIEMLLVVAIIGILAGAILVSISSQRDKARQAKMLAELSGTLQPIVMCLSDNKTINEISNTGGGQICSVSGYGTWPVTSNNDFGRYYMDADFTDGNWHFYTKQNGVSSYVCCNSESSKCAITTSASCDGISL